MKWLSIIFLSSFGSCFGTNILGVLLVPSPSHYKWHKSYVLDLAKRRHNVTVLNYDKETENVSNYTTITLEGVYQKLYENIVLEDINYSNILEIVKQFSYWDAFTCKLVLESKEFRLFLKNYEKFKFDLIIWDIVNPKCLYPLAERFGNPPIIATSPFGLQPYLAYSFGNNIHSYIPFYQSLLSDRMHFLDRLRNSFYVYFMYLYRDHWISSQEEETAKTYFGSNVGSLVNFHRNISLLLTNNDPLFQYAEPLTPNIIPVGGLHITPQNKLPQNLEEVFHKTEGVIYVSLGTNLDFTKIDNNKRKAFLSDFSKLPYTILLKTQEGNFEVPKNVIIKTWFPQDAILAHSKTKLFITHGGLSSTLQALYYGVPMIGIPFIADQFGNVHNIEQKMLGVKVDYSKISPNVLYNSVLEVLNNPKYKENVNIISKRFRNQLTTPLETAVYWTEYLLKYGSAEHLSPATRDMSIFERLDLDILFVVILLFISIVALILMLVVKLYKIVCYSKNKKLKGN